MNRLFDRLNDIRRFDYLKSFKRIVMWIDKPNSLICLIAITSLIAIIIGASMFYINNKKTNLDLSAMWTNDLNNRFVQKHDLFRFSEILSHFCFSINEKECIYIPVESQFIQQAYIAYMAMNGAKYADQSCVESIDTPEKYMSIVDVSRLDNVNNLIYSSFLEKQRLEKIENFLFFFLILTQIINILFAMRLSYKER